MLIFSRIRTFAVTKRYGLHYSSMFLFPKSYFKVFKGGKIRIESGNKLVMGCNWTNLPFFTTGIKVDSGARLTVKGKFNVYSGSVIAVYEKAELTLGSGYFNNFCDVHCFHKINIGKNVIISSHVNIRDSDNHNISGQKAPMSAPIIIEDNVWIGMRATILKGVTIGKGAVVAAGAIVTKDVPPYSLVAGNPAKVIRENINWQ